MTRTPATTVVALPMLGLVLSGCGFSAGSSEPGSTGAPDATSQVGVVAIGAPLSEQEQESCRAVFSSAPSSPESVVLVLDRTASNPLAELPRALTDDLHRTSLAGGSLTVIGVNGQGTAPTVLVKQAGLSRPGPRDAPSVEDIARHISACVGWLSGTTTPQGTGTDLYAAAALAGEVTDAESTVWWLTDLQINAGQASLVGVNHIDDEASEAAAATTARAPLDLGGATLKIDGIGNTTQVIPPAAREWLTDFAKALCKGWKASGCGKIRTQPGTGQPVAAAASLPDDPALPWPSAAPTTATAASQGCYYQGIAHFAASTDRMLEGEENRVKRLIASMQSHPRSTARVTGHTASKDRATREEHLRLSLQRAKVVGDHLVAAGIAPDRITTNGVGDRDPIAEDVDPASGKQLPDKAHQERRVDVSVSGAPCLAR